MTLLIKISTIQWVFEKNHVNNAVVGWSIAILLIKFLAWGGDSQFTRLENKDTQYRSIHRRCSVRKGVLRNFAKFTGKHLCQSLFLNKVADLRSAALLKKRLWHWCFSVIFPKFLRTPFLQSTSRKLLLESEHVCTEIYSFFSLLKNIKTSVQKSCDKNLTFFS